MTTSAYFTRAANLQRLHDGPLGPYIDLYASRLVGEGYRRLTAWRCLHLVGDFSCWLKRRQLGVHDVDEQAVAAYLTDRVEQRRPQPGDQSWLWKSEQRDKWSFCLKAARMAGDQERYRVQRQAFYEVSI